MAQTYANYQVVSLSGNGFTNNVFPFDSSNYRTATTVHQVFCLGTGVATIYPMAGPSFIWSATTNTSIDVLVSAVTVSSGTFIGFKARFELNPFYGKGDRI
jgi:hypothetical protein